jgi:plasmid stabilization system protein ParE
LARVEYDAAFLSDVRRQTEWLAIDEEWQRIVRLHDELTNLVERLMSFPELGRELKRERGRTMRRISVGRLPFFVWYQFYPHGEGVLRLSRLFHAGQHTPRPRVF